MQLGLFFVIGYVVTVAIELPVLLIGLAEKRKRSDRVTAAFLLTAFSYPAVVLVFPAIFTLMECDNRNLFLLVAETYAPLAEVALFRFMHYEKVFAKLDRDAFVIIAANLCSFLLGEIFLSQKIGELVDFLLPSAGLGCCSVLR